MTARLKILRKYIDEFLVSKETVVLRRWESEDKNLVLSNELIKVELPPP